MLGQATAPLYPAPRRWVRRAWGAADIDVRQKWQVLWPHLARLPRTSLRVLDAGSGDGQWAMELAARRPRWQVTGLDCSYDRVVTATAASRRLQLHNADFVCADFLAFQPTVTYDAVLTVDSAHYLVEEGAGAQLFQRFGTWLVPGGRLLLLGPRRVDEVPRLRHLPLPFRPRDLFDADALLALCRGAGLTVDLLAPCVGPLATYAKQLSRYAGASRVRQLASYPLQLVLTLGDGLRGAAADVRRGMPSAAWLLLAHRAPPVGA
ncbi:MAG TPA: class I SAM-dependent methyltransferase [Gemmatimonadaceae bacterium]|nr:class I SAM-dependent methyltransferase [Gemmatimonadaceae bacterium]